jgi:hypothetical protein
MGESTALLWRTIYGAGQGFVGLLAGRRPDGAGATAGRLQGIRTAYFEYPGALPAAAAWGLDSSERGLESYFCAHLLRARRRTKDAAAPVLTLWADADGEPIPDAPEPTAVVQSSPGRAHLFWRLKHPLSPTAAEGLNRRLALSLGADRSGWDLSQLLRPPGTRNRKYAGAPAVELVEIDAGVVYHPRELDLILPEAPQPAAAARAADTRARILASPDSVDLSRLSVRARTLIARGNAGAGAPYASRSEADFAVCLAMFSAGYDEAEVRAVITDFANGISDKYREKGRYGDSYLSLTIANARARHAV